VFVFGSSFPSFPSLERYIILRHSFGTIHAAVMHCLLRLSLIFLCALDRAWAAEPPSPFGPYDYGIDRNTILKRQSSNSLAVNGVHTRTGPNGSLPLRLEIRDLEKDNNTWTLYLLGLDMLQSKNQTEMLSWYSLAGGWERCLC